MKFIVHPIKILHSCYQVINNQANNAWTYRLCYICLCLYACIGISSCKSGRVVTSSYGDCDNKSHVEVHVGHPDKIERRLIEEAKTWLGTPYKYACAEKGEGTDCSGMVMKVYESVTGEKLPRNSAKQAEYCELLNTDKVEAGDLVFFATGKDPEKVSHVGLVIDDCNFIHASSTKGVVISDFTTPYYQRTFVMFGRVPKRKNLVSQN